eukprot:5799170-Pyramimonas_sp.AAC.1
MIKLRALPRPSASSWRRCLQGSIITRDALVFGLGEAVDAHSRRGSSSPGRARNALGAEIAANCLAEAAENQDCEPLSGNFAACAQCQ